MEVSQAPYEVRRGIALCMLAEMSYLQKAAESVPPISPSKHREHMAATLNHVLSAMRVGRRATPPNEVRPYLAEAETSLVSMEEALAQDGGRMRLLDDVTAEMWATQTELGSGTRAAQVFLKLQGVLEPLLGKSDSEREAERRRFLESFIDYAVADASGHPLTQEQRFRLLCELLSHMEQIEPTVRRIKQREARRRLFTAFCARHSRTTLPNTETIEKELDEIDWLFARSKMVIDSEDSLLHTTYASLFLLQNTLDGFNHEYRTALREGNEKRLPALESAIRKTRANIDEVASKLRELDGWDKQAA